MKRRRGRARSLPLGTRKGQTSARNMTTRRAASKAATISSEGSSTSADSRRSSLADSTHMVGGDDIDSSRPAKRARRTSLVAEHRPVTRRQKTHSREPIESPAKSSRDSLAPELPTIEEPENDDDQIEQSATNGDRDGDEDQDGFASEADHKLSPLPKRRGRKPKIKTATTSASRLQGLTASWEHENGTDHEGSVVPSRATSRAPDRVAKPRMPGRRRAPHADSNIEADLRRQLQLRLGYRSVAKALKPLLAELSQRGIDALEDDEEAHQQGEEYTAVMAELDARLQSRLVMLETERRIKTDFRVEWLRLQKDELRRRFVDRVKVLKDDYHTKAENILLELIREHEREIDDDATEDEDGIVGPQYGKTTNANPTGRLDHKFDSRSRFYLVTERSAERRKKQIAMQSLRRDFVVAEDHDETAEELDAPNENEYPSGFGLTSASRREYATSVLNLKSLLRATEAVENGEQPEEQIHPAIPNEDATGLQVLADLLGSQPPIVLPTRTQPRVQTPGPPPVVVKQELDPVEFIGAGLRGGDEHVVDLTTPQRKRRESSQDIFSALEQNLNLAYLSPQKTTQLEDIPASHTAVSPAEKKHQRKQPAQSSVASPKGSKAALAVQPGFQIPGLQIPGPQPIEQFEQPNQPTSRMQATTASEVLFWASEASKTLQNGNASISSADVHTLPRHDDRQLDTRAAQPPAAGTNRPEPRQPLSSTNARRSPVPTASASRWDSLYEQNCGGSRDDVGTAERHNFQAKSAHDRSLSESVRSSTNQYSDASKASTPAHRRNMSIPAQVTSPKSFLRSQSPGLTDPGRRGYMNPLITDLAPNQRTDIPGSDSQSAVDVSGKREQPPPGRWHEGQHRNPPSTTRDHNPPPPPQPPGHRRTPPIPYPPVSGSSSGVAYQHQFPSTTGPTYRAPPLQPQGPYFGPYQGPPPPGPQQQYPQPPPSSSAPQYEYRPTIPYLPPQPQPQQQPKRYGGYAGGVPPHYQPQPPAPLGFLSGPPPDSGPPPPPGAVFSPRFAEHPPSSSSGGQHVSGQRPSSPRSGEPPLRKDGSGSGPGPGGRDGGWAKRE